MTFEQAITQIACNLGRIADVLEGQVTSVSASNLPPNEPQTDLREQKETQESPTEEKTEASVTKEDAQNALVNLTEAMQDNCKAARAILEELGAKKMSDVAESDYAVIIDKCQQKLAEAAQ